MKKIIGLFFALVFSVQLQAQHDSIATNKAVPPAITLDTTLDKQKKTNDSLSLSSTEKQRKTKSGNLIQKQQHGYRQQFPD